MAVLISGGLAGIFRLPRLANWIGPIDLNKRQLSTIGQYNPEQRYSKRWHRERGAATASAYVPLTFVPGEAYQFDWSHEIVLINGVTVTVKVAHVRLCHSRMLFVRASAREPGDGVRRP